MFVPDGVVTRIASGLSSVPHSIRYPGGKNVLNPWIRAGCPLKRVETRWMTPGVSILRRAKSVIHSREKLFTQAKHIRLTLEIFHYVQEPIIDVGLVDEADFDLVQIAERVLIVKTNQLVEIL